MRPVAYTFIRKEVRNGQNTFFWYDNWLRKGKLLDITGDSGPSSLGIPATAKVCDAVCEGEWTIGTQRQQRHTEIIATINQEPSPTADQGADVTLWKQSFDKYSNAFSSTATWEQIRVRRDRVDWASLIWFSQAVPRFSFIAWLAFLNRLSTGDRMRKWGYQQGCVFCGERDETRDHLFFACPYTFTVWSNLSAGLLRKPTDPDWKGTVAMLSESDTPTLDGILLRLLFQTSIYHLWRERNSRRNQGRLINVSHMTRTIDRIMRNRILALKYKAPHKYEGLMRRWLMAVDP